MWQAIRSFFMRKGSAVPAETHHADSRRSRVTIVSVLLEDQDRSLIAEVCYQNQWYVFFAKTCAEARQVSEQIKPHVIL